MSDQKVAWITGGSSGIGRACALEFAAYDYRIGLHFNTNEQAARELKEELEADGTDVLLLQGDVSSPDAVAGMVAEIDSHYGQLDVLVNNAGSLIERRSFEAMTVDLWDKIMEVNLKSVYLCSQAALGLLRRNESSRIVNISSVAARNGGGPGSVAYSVAKSGVSNLTRAMAKELVTDGILVNGVAPGVISTPFHDRFTSAEAREGLKRALPIGREGLPKEVANVVLFLASPAASYLVGEIIEVNGGQLMD